RSGDRWLSPYRRVRACAHVVAHATTHAGTATRPAAAAGAAGPAGTPDRDDRLGPRLPRLRAHSNGECGGGRRHPAGGRAAPTAPRRTGRRQWRPGGELGADTAVPPGAAGDRAAADRGDRHPVARRWVLGATVGGHAGVRDDRAVVPAQPGAAAVRPDRAVDREQG